MTTVTPTMPRRFYWHYAYIIVVLTFLVLLFAATTRAIPSLIIKPLEAEYGWDRSSISFAVAISLFAYGFVQAGMTRIYARLNSTM